MHCMCVRHNAVAAENEKLKTTLYERERTLYNVQRSLSQLQDRLSLLTPRDFCNVTEALDQLDAVSRVLHNVARDVSSAD